MNESQFFQDSDGGEGKVARPLLPAATVLHGVGADGVGVKFPIFAVNFAVVCPCPLGKAEKGEEKGEKSEKTRGKKA